MKTNNKEEEEEEPKNRKNLKSFNKNKNKIETVYIMSDAELLDTARYFLNNKN
jgi:hypothetical protein